MLPIALSQLAITFPNIDPVIVQFGPIAIRWYSLAYIVGIVFGWWYAKRLVENDQLWGGKAPLTALDLDDFLLWATLGIVLGGRLGYVLFYDFAQFAANPASIVQVWNGGMSFHGGLAGTVIAMFLFARSRGIPFWSLTDVIGAVSVVGIGLGRVANFINGELWGRISNVPWAMEFPGGGPFTRHPSQLYEALLEGLVLFIILRFATHRMLKLQYPGFVTGLFIGGYGVARIIVENFREPDPQLGYLLGGWLTMGMLLSLPMVLLGLWLMASARKAERPDRSDD